MAKTKNYAMTEEMITNIKSHVSTVFIFVDKDMGTNVGSFIVENCGTFHPIRMLFHFNPNNAPSDCEEEYIREVVYIDTREGHDGYAEAVKELCQRITPKFRKLWGREIHVDTVTDIINAVKDMGRWAVQAL